MTFNYNTTAKYYLMQEMQRRGFYYRHLVVYRTKSTFIFFLPGIGVEDGVVSFEIRLCCLVTEEGGWYTPGIAIPPIVVDCCTAEAPSRGIEGSF